jgi:hypothetical protein
MTMFRFKDDRGLGHVLADMDELRAAIADGRVRPGTPFAEDEGSWTIARRHPAYQEAAAAAGPGKADRVGLVGGGFDWGSFARAATVRYGAVALVALATVVAMRGQRVTPAEREQYIRALTVLVEEQEMPAGLEVPPKAKPLRATWAVMRAIRDVNEHMDRTQASFGFDDDIPKTWLSNDHIRRPRAHPEIPVHWAAMGRFHQVYADSVLPLTEKALRARGAEAGIGRRELDQLLADMRSSVQSSIEVHRTSLALSWAAVELHNMLVSQDGHVSIDYRGNLTFQNDRIVGYYRRTAGAVDSLVARLDSLESASLEAGRKAIASLKN